jgi:hypothetical protein
MAILGIMIQLWLGICLFALPIAILAPFVYPYDECGDD